MEAALWLVNKMVEEGYSIGPGHVIITGALGKMIPGKPGAYEADYGSFSTVAFEIRSWSKRAFENRMYKGRAALARDWWV